jgi:translation initiation factor 1
MADIVWSSDDGDLRTARARGAEPRPAAGGRVKVRRETAGRRGKAVTTIADLPLDDAAVKALAGKLKKRCGVGGSAKNGEGAEKRRSGPHTFPLTCPPFGGAAAEAPGDRQRPTA